MANNRPDPSEFIEQAQRMLRELFSNAGGNDAWAGATRSPTRTHEPSPEEQRENLTFALATRAVEALEDLALNVAAIRQRLERTSGEDRPKRKTKAPRPDGDAPTAT